jgi:hypothetical protein
MEASENYVFVPEGVKKNLEKFQRMYRRLMQTFVLWKRTQIF